MSKCSSSSLKFDLVLPPTYSMILYVFTVYDEQINKQTKKNTISEVENFNSMFVGGWLGNLWCRALSWNEREEFIDEDDQQVDFVQ